MILFKRILNRIQQQLKITFYSKPRVYAVNYQVRVANIARQTQKITLIVPVLKNESEQRSVINDQFNVRVEIKTERKFGNQYAVFKHNLSSQQTIKLQEQVKMIICPLKTGVGQNLKIFDYDKNQEEYQKYIKSDAFLNSELPETQKIVNHVIGRERRVGKITLKLYNYVIERLNYGDAYLGLYTAKEALERDKCDCGGFSSLLGALYKSAGIPSRIVSGFWAGYKNNNMHAWLEFLTPGNQWIPVDPAVDHLARQGRTSKLGGFGVIGSDRIITSKGQDMQIDINGQMMNIDILQNPIVIAEQGNNSYKLEFEFHAIRQK